MENHANHKFDMKRKVSLQIHTLKSYFERRTNLKDPVCATQKPSYSQGEYVMSCEGLNNLQKE